MISNRIKLTLIISVLFCTSGLFAQTEHTGTFTKEKLSKLMAIKAKKEAKTANQQNIPTLDAWKADVDKKLANEDCEGLLNLQWAFPYQYVTDYGEYSMLNKGFIILPAYGDEGMQGSKDLFKEYWIKVGTMLGKCNKIDFLLTDYYYINTLDDFRGNEPFFYVTDFHLDNYLEMWIAISEHLKGEGKSLRLIFADMLNNNSYTSEQRNNFSEKIRDLINYTNNYDYSSENMDKLVDALFLYYTESIDWIAFFGNFKYKPALPKIINALKSSEPNIRITAANFLGYMEEKSALPKLQILAENDPYYFIDDYGYRVYTVREAANAAIQKIELADD